MAFKGLQKLFLEQLIFARDCLDIEVEHIFAFEIQPVTPQHF